MVEVGMSWVAGGGTLAAVVPLPDAHCRDPFESENWSRSAAFSSSSSLTRDSSVAIFSARRARNARWTSRDLWPEGKREVVSAQRSVGGDRPDSLAMQAALADGKDLP